MAVKTVTSASASAGGLTYSFTVDGTGPYVEYLDSFNGAYGIKDSTGAIMEVSVSTDGVEGYQAAVTEQAGKVFAKTDAGKAIVDEVVVALNLP